MKKTRYAQVGLGDRGQYYYDAIAAGYPDKNELVAFCDVNQGRMNYANDYIVSFGAEKVPTYKHYEFDKMIEETKPDYVIVTSVDRTHDYYIIRAMELGCDVITEKPITIDEKRAQGIIDAQKRTGRKIRVTFNLRFTPHHTKVRELIMNGVIGDVYAVHFEWFLDTRHGASYFRRWHRNKANSGGLLVHKSTHHFDLVNFWLDSKPETVYAMGGLNFYGRTAAERRGVKEFYYRSYGNEAAKRDPFYFDIEQHPLVRAIYKGCEEEDGYIYDKSVFSEEIDIEDTMGVMVRYKNNAILTYSLHAYCPLEGLRVSFAGSKGRIDYEVFDRNVFDDNGERSTTKSEVYSRKLMVHEMFGKSYEVEMPVAVGNHGGGDISLANDLFGTPIVDEFNRQANHVDGIMSALVGIAANKSMASGLPVKIDDLVKF